MRVMPWLLVTLMALTIQSSAPGHGLKVWRSKPSFKLGSASLSLGSHSWMFRGSYIWRLCPGSSTFFTCQMLWPSAFLVLPLCIDPRSSLFFSIFFSQCLQLVVILYQWFTFLPRGHGSASYSNSELNYLLASRDR